MPEFNLQSEYKPAGDQPKAIKDLVKGVQSKDPFQVLLGVTGSGKTFTMANLIQEVNRPTLILTHNKTLAGQLYQEFREFFPENAVEYFVSYYDYYQPEAYVVTTDTFIEKDAGINDEIDKLRMRATTSLLTRNDVIVVASVSCIYGLGNPKDYKDMMLPLTVGQEIERDDILKSLVKIQYNRNDIQLDRGCFRVRGDVVEIHPAYDDYLYRIEMFGDEIESLARVHSLTGKVLNVKESISIAPAKHFVTKEENMDRVLQDISVELDSRLIELKNEDKILEYQRLKSRVKYDMEMLDETGFCPGIENYSRIIENRPPGSRPSTLFDFFPQEALFLIDESHVSIPQVGGMFNGDQARKSNLVEYGFRLPSAMDNRPMKFQEFEERYFDSVVYISATPGNYELEKSEGVVVEQVIRPTGLLDPKIEIHPIENQLDHLVTEIKEVILRDERVLVTTLTKKMAEDLSDYLNDLNFKVRYLHSDIKTPERTEILKDLRMGTFDILIGINLLREGLDIPEVSLVAILDADKEGFLRSHRSLIQTMGRAARNVNGKVILFADRITDSMKSAMQETSRRRKIQETHNQEHGITPKTVRRKIGEDLKVYDPLQDVKVSTKLDESSEMNLEELEAKMHQAAAELNFEEAARLRDLLQSKGV